MPILWVENKGFQITLGCDRVRPAPTTSARITFNGFGPGQVMGNAIAGAIEINLITATGVIEGYQRIGSSRRA